MSFLPQRLNGRIILIVSCVLLATGVTSGWLTARNQTASLLTSMRLNASLITKNFAESCARNLLVRDYADLETFLVKAAALSDVRRIQVCEPDGALLWDIERGLDGQPHSKTGIIRLSPPLSHTAVIEIDNDLLVIWQPVMAGNLLGWFKADFSLSAIHEAQARIWRNILLVAMAWVVCSAFLIILVLRPIVRSIGKLTTFAMHLDDRKGAQISISGQPLEIAALGASLNDASAKLLATDRQLFNERERLRESEAMYRSLVTTMAEGVVLRGADGKITAANPAAEKIEGRTLEQMIGTVSGESERRAIYEDGRPFPEELHPSLITLRTGEPQSDVVMGIWRPDGELVWISVNSQPVISPGESAPNAVVTTFHDITGRKQAEEALHLQTVELEEEVAERQMAQENLQEKALLLEEEIEERCTAQNELKKLNDELEQRVRQRTAELEGKNGELLDRSRELQENQQALMSIVDDLNQKTGELEKANAQLLDLDRLKSMFIASMSHELRTPLNSIIGFSSILRDEWLGPVNPEQKDNLETIQRSGKHLLSLINDVIDVSKIEAGRIEIHVEEFDLYDLLTEAIQYVEKELGDKGLELRLDIHHYPLCTDKRRLLQCVINLLSNAVKFTEHGRITVSAAVIGQETGEPNPSGPAPAMVKISVNDTGIGIAAEDILRLFEAFVRLESPLKTTVPGTGLGLYLTRKLVVDVLHGDILCNSTLGSGSTFTLRIPEWIYEKGFGSRG